MPSRTHARAAAPASLLTRLAEEVRAACRQVAQRERDARPLRGEGPHPIGEWLGTVRQPTGEFRSLGHSPRAGLPSGAPERWGDLTRTRVTRIKGERGSLHDAVTRDRGL